jgi:hypothetical protein
MDYQDNSGKHLSNISFYYHPVYTILFFICTLPYFVGLPFLCYFEFSNGNTVIAIVVLVIFLFLSGVMFPIAQAFFRMIAHRPALQLNKNEIHDHWNGVHLHWPDINHITSSKLRWHFLCIKTVSDKTVLHQVNNPSARLFMKMGKWYPPKTLLKINLNFLRGKSDEIFSKVSVYWERNRHQPSASN